MVGAMCILIKLSNYLHLLTRRDHPTRRKIQRDRTSTTHVNRKKHNKGKQQTIRNVPRLPTKNPKRH